MNYGPGSSIATVITPYGPVHANWSRVLPDESHENYGGVKIAFSVPKITTLSLSIAMLGSNHGVSADAVTLWLLKVERSFGKWPTYTRFSAWH